MNKIKFVILFLIVLFLVSMSASYLIGKVETKVSEKIVVIPLKGPIFLEQSSGSLFESSAAGANEVIADLRRANSDDSVKAVIIEINSPGGTVVASQEIADAVKAMNKTTVAVIREVGASGAYWVASATDTIIASPMSITGSIGVLGSYLEFSGLFEKYGVGYERFIGGKYKDLASPLKAATDEERVLLQKKIDTIHEYFIQAVAANRNMDKAKVREVATGEFFLGTEAKELGLVDQLGNKEDAIQLIKNTLQNQDLEVVEYTHEKGVWDILSELSTQSSYVLGRGIGDSVKETTVQTFVPQA